MPSNMSYCQQRVIFHAGAAFAAGWPATTDHRGANDVDLGV
jgi:hypothetical protein